MSTLEPIAPPLLEEDQRRGRRLAITSHPAGNTFRMLFTQHLPTLALVSLGASELQVGVQSAFVFAFIGFQLPTLRAVAHVSKRTILVSSHLFAVAAALPLVFWGRLPTLAAALPVPVSPADLAMACFALVAFGVCVGETVWFPMLRAYVHPERIGRFFGTLRTGWHLALIGFYLFSQAWLRRHPGDFSTLFGVGFALGVARTFLIARMPERSERTGQRIRVREAVALLRDVRLRSYLATSAWSQSMRIAAVPFVIVMLRRASGFSDDQVLYTTVAHFTGGVASLYLWGRVVDRVGAVAVLRVTIIGQALLVAALLFFAPVSAVVPLMVLWFFALSVLASGYGVADTHVLFELTPPEAPARTLVLGAVGVGLAGGLVPVLAGAVLDAWLPVGIGADALPVYRVFFGVLGAVLVLALAPLQVLDRARRAVPI
jgi:predicted MFS family arabinose efflux permease